MGQGTDVLVCFCFDLCSSLSLQQCNSAYFSAVVVLGFLAKMASVPPVTNESGLMR